MNMRLPFLKVIEQNSDIQFSGWGGIVRLPMRKKQLCSFVQFFCRRAHTIYLEIPTFGLTPEYVFASI